MLFSDASLKTSLEQHDENNNDECVLTFLGYFFTIMILDSGAGHNS